MVCVRFSTTKTSHEAVLIQSEPNRITSASTESWLKYFQYPKLMYTMAYTNAMQFTNPGPSEIVDFLFTM